MKSWYFRKLKFSSKIQIIATVDTLVSISVYIYIKCIERIAQWWLEETTYFRHMVHGCSSQNARYPLISFFLGTEIPLGKKKKKVTWSIWLIQLKRGQMRGSWYWFLQRRAVWIELLRTLKTKSREPSSI